MISFLSHEPFVGVHSLLANSSFTCYLLEKVTNAKLIVADVAGNKNSLLTRSKIHSFTRCKIRLLVVV